MKRSSYAPDISRLAEEIAVQCADIMHDCAVTLMTREKSQVLEQGMPCAGERRFVVDGASGLLLGLSVLMLCHDGRLSLESSARELLGGMELPVEPTVQRLLTRRTGLPDPLRQHMMVKMCGDELVPGQESPERECAKRRALLAHRRLEAQLGLCDGRKAAPPGFEPSLMDGAVLTAMAERAAGESLEQFQRSRIFAPLGIEAEPAEGAEGLFSLSLNEINRIGAALLRGELLSDETTALAVKLAAGRGALPFCRRQGFLCGSAGADDSTVEILLDEGFECCVVIASGSALPIRRNGDVYRRLDTCIIDLVNGQRIYPAHTRMERLSGRNLAGALALAPEPEQAEFVDSAAAAIAQAAADCGREVFLATERGVTVGLLCLSTDSPGAQARLETLLVDSRFQRRGFGGIMVSWALKYLGKKGARRVQVCVDRRNAAALALYRRKGFEPEAVYDSVLVLALVTGGAM